MTAGRATAPAPAQATGAGHDLAAPAGDADPTAPARWARVAAWAAVACVVPSGLWWVAVGLGVDLGWSRRQLEFQQIPGSGTAYVVALSVVSLTAATLTLALVQPQAVRIPRWIPWLGGRPVSAAVVVGSALVGSAAVIWISAMSVIRWHRVNGFGDQRLGVWEVVMTACYAPALLWGPLVIAVTLDYRRRHRTPLHRRRQRRDAEATGTADVEPS